MLCRGCKGDRDGIRSGRCSGNIFGVVNCLGGRAALHHGSRRYEMLVGYRAGDVWSPQLEMTEALGVELKHFIGCIEHDTTPIVDGRAGLRIVRLLEAATQSMRNAGRPVELSTNRCSV